MPSYAFKTRPFPWQRTGSIHLVKHGDFALFMDPRTGKTKTAIDAVGMLALRQEVRRVLVLCPLVAIDVWLEELAAHAPYPYRTRVVNSDNFEKAKNRGGPSQVDFFLINYDRYRQRARRASAWDYPWVSAIEGWQPDLIICDESHRVKSAGGVTSQALWRSVRRMRDARPEHTPERSCPKVWLLTGTPNPKGWLDIFAQFRVMDPRIFGTAKADFEDEHIVYGVGRRKWTVVRYKKLRRLTKKVAAHSYSVPGEVLEGYPAQWQNVPVALPPNARRMYNEMAEELVTYIQADHDHSEGDDDNADTDESQVIEAANPGVRRIRLLQITGGFTTTQQLHGAKVQALRDLAVDLHEQRQSVVVYCRFLAEVAAATDVLHGLQFRVGTITGSTPTKDRTQFRVAFNAGRLDALVFQANAGSLAIDLAATCHEVIYFSLPDSWETYFQSSQRVRGPKQTQHVRYRHLICPGTVDVSVLRALKNKADMHSELMKNPRGFVFGE